MPVRGVRDDEGRGKGGVTPRFFTWVVGQVLMPLTKIGNSRRASLQRNIMVPKVEKPVRY